jgi:hypothetical protein
MKAISYPTPTSSAMDIAPKSIISSVPGPSTRKGMSQRWSTRPLEPDGVQEQHQGRRQRSNEFENSIVRPQFNDSQAVGLHEEAKSQEQ